MALPIIPAYIIDQIQKEKEISQEDNRPTLEIIDEKRRDEPNNKDSLSSISIEL